jgi:hypothetical protein
MSTQLVLYPQSYKGQYSSTFTSAAVEYLVDGINFLTMNASDSITNSGTLADILTTQPPNIVNTWYRARTDAAVAYPTENNGVLAFNSVSGVSASTFIYQRLDNLTVGQIYTVTVNVASNTSGAGILGMINGTTIVGIQGASSIFGYSMTQITTTFTAETTQDIFFITWGDNINNLFYISSISVTTSILNPSGVYTELQDGQVICDLYQDEDIPLTLSIDEFKNVAEKVQSYSKDFKLPATKRNNQIFNNMFEITRADDKLIFNPYVKTRCVLKQDGFILFEGYLRMIDIKDKEGEISYNVNLYSEVIAFADILENLTLADLNLSELAHTYNFTSIINSWSDITGLPLINPLTDPNEFAGVVGASNTQVLKYPFIDWTHQYIVGGTNPVANNAAIGFPELINLEQAFRPCIQLKYLIDKIFAGTNFTYTSSFFDTADFGKLFMDFNWGADNAPMIGGSTVDLRVSTTSTIPTVLSIINTWESLVSTSGFLGYDSATGIFTAQNNNQIYVIFINLALRPPIIAADTVVDLSIVVNGIAVDTFTATLEGDAVGTAPFVYWTTFYVTQPLSAGDTWSIQIIGDNAFSWVPYTGDTSLTVGTVVSEIADEVLLDTLRGEIGQWDFLKGIFTMFNLITLADEENPNNILIEPYADVFIKNTNSLTATTPNDNSLAARSIEYDWTDKVDISQMELNPLTDLNETTIFKFVEDEDDYIFNVLKQAQNHLYGSLVHSASGFTLLQGTKEITAEPFAATVSKSLMSQYPEFIVPALYTMNDDGSSEGFDNSPRIFYNNGIKGTGASYYVPAQNGVSEFQPTTFLQFSHLSDIPTAVSTPPASTDTRDFVFNSSQLLSGLGTPPVDNLYNTYWAPYFNELYHADTRMMTLKVNLSPADIATFKFTDTVMIKNRSFRVNKIEYKPNSLAKVEFILLP